MSTQISTPGERLKKMLADRNMKQADLARELKTTRSSVNGLVRGRRGIGIALGRQIADVFDMTLDDFFEELGIKPQRKKAGTPQSRKLVLLIGKMPDDVLGDVLDFAEDRLARKRGRIAGSKRKDN